jgi:hypothetical protein
VAYGCSGDFLTNEEKFGLKFLESFAKGAEASEKVTLGIISLLGIGIIYQSQYNLYIFIVFVLFIVIHFLNMVFKPTTPTVIKNSEALCPHCKIKLETIRYYCPNCKREI